MLVKVDAAALEWRVAVLLSQDEVGLQELQEGRDAHEANRVAFSLPSRFIAKIYLFRTIYKGSGWSFANDRDFNHVSDDPKYWDGINEVFYKKYAGLDNKHKEWAQLVAEGKPIIGITGRQWKLSILSDRYGKPRMPWTTLTNHPVQGTGADIMTVARISIAKRMKAAKLKSILISTVHDDIMADCPPEEVKTVGKIMYEAFDDLPKNFKALFGVDMNIPFPGEVKIGLNMADMKDLTYEECLK